MNKVEINNLRKEYGSKVALDDVSITLQNGKIYGLIGKNGAGKTTIMKILSGIINQNQGQFDI